MTAYLLNDVAVKTQIAKEIEFATRLQDEGQDSYDVWTTLKHRIKALLQDHEESMNRKRDHIVKRLQRSLDYQRQLHVQFPDVPDVHTITDRITTLHNAIRDHVEKRTETALQRSQEKWASEGERHTKYFFNMLRSSSSTLIPGLRTDQDPDLAANNITYDKDEMCAITDAHFQALFSPEPADEHEQETFLDSVSERLSIEEAAATSANYSLDEVLDAITETEGGSVPGHDGLTIELYKAFKDKIAPLMTKVYNDLLNMPKMPASFLIGMVVLFYKNGDASNIANYRPITLLNADYKVLTSILSTRVKDLCLRLVGPTQFAFLRGRQCADNLMATQLAIEHQLRSKAYGAVVLLDWAKAYDRVLHSWMYKVLARLGFAPRFGAWIRSLYAEAQSCFLVNGHISSGVQLKRGVRQGDSLSCYLYLLVMVPLVNHIERTTPFQGFPCLMPAPETPGVDGAGRWQGINGGNADWHPVGTLFLTQYADDTTLYLANPETDLPNVRTLLTRWGSATNARVNFGKSTVIPLGKHNNLLAEGFTTLPRDKNIRLLGLFFDREGLVPAREIWPKILTRMEGITGGFAGKRLTIQGRTLLYKSLALPIAIFTAKLIMPRAKDCEKMDRIERKVAFNWKQATIKYATLQQTKEKGGMRLLNHRLYFQTHAVQWVKRRITRPDLIWTRQMDLLEATYNKGRWGDPLIQKHLPIDNSTQLWKQIWSIFRMFNGSLKEPEYQEDALAQPLLFNEYFDWDKLPNNPTLQRRRDPAIISFRKCETVQRFHHLWDKEVGMWRVPACNCSEYHKRMHWQALEVINEEWNEWSLLPAYAGNEGDMRARALAFNLESGVLPVVDTNHRDLYDALSDTYIKVEQKYKDTVQWVSTMTTRPHLFWKGIFSKHRNRRSNELHYKIIHQGLQIGGRLTWLEATHPNATKCRLCLETETHEHLFSTCAVSKTLWQQVTQLINKIHHPNQVDNNIRPWDWIRMGCPINEHTTSTKNALNANIQGTALRAIWLDRNHHVFQDKPRSLQGTMNRFTQEYVRLLRINLHKYVRKKKMMEFLKFWGQNSVLAHSTPGGRIQLITAEELRIKMTT
jgi:hypothetical protein